MEKEFDFTNIGKRMPYSVPDGFFDKLEENVMVDVRGKKNEDKATAKFSILRSPFSIKQILFAAAAAVALFFVVQATLFKSEPQHDFASVEQAFDNLDTEDQDYLLAVYDEDLFINEPYNEQEK